MATMRGGMDSVSDEMVEACDAAWWRLPRVPVQDGYR